MIQRRAVLVVVLSVLAIADVARAWHNGGHEIVGVIAYRQLDAATRNKVVSILKKHPRYQEDFVEPMAQELDSPSKQEQGEWMFARAAIWPDMARQFKGADKAYNHPTWHYLDIPVYLAESDKRELRLDDVDLDPDYSRDMPQNKMNVLHALKWCEQTLTSSHSKASEKALAICWELHLTGDVHQPCHAAALFAAHLLPEGDHGGNWIMVGGTELHGRWDALLGDKLKLATVTQRTDAVLGEARNVNAAKAAEDNLTPGDWLTESHDIAEAAVYTKELKDQIEVIRANGHVELHNKPKPKDSDLLVISLSEAYFKDPQHGAKVIAAEQVAKAGYRMAKVLHALLH